MSADTPAIVPGAIVRARIIRWTYGTVLLVHGNFAWVKWQQAEAPITHKVADLLVMSDEEVRS